MVIKRFELMHFITIKKKKKLILVILLIILMNNNKLFLFQSNYNHIFNHINNY